MLTCTEAARLIARAADDAAALGDARHGELDAHIVHCAECRAALDDQRQVARALHLRPLFPVPLGFEARLAARLDRESAGWLALANWRAWTVGLAPIAAALVLVAWLVPEQSLTRGSTAVDQEAPAAVVQEPASAVSFDAWPASDALSTQASVFLEPGSGGDALLEAVLLGGGLPAGDRRDVH
jgi:hypothetical protein